MLFRAAASVAILACASHVAAEPMPYQPAFMPLPGLSLMRRDTSGYQPEETKCHDGNTCAEACGVDFTQCPSGDKLKHCFNPAAAQSCCYDGSGSSCEAGYYCTHDTKMETWCCPDSMDVTACAAAYSVKGGLETATLTTSTPIPTSTSTSTTSTTSSTPTTTSTPTHKKTTKEAVVTKVKAVTTSVCPSSGFTSAWTGSNSTITSFAPTQPTETAPGVPATTTTGSSPAHPTTTGGASANAVSALLLLAAGAVAFL